MKKRVTYGIMILIGVSLIIGIPYIIWKISPQFLTEENQVPNISDWLSFNGSYLGGIFGGVCTLAGVLITLKVNTTESMKPLLIINFEEKKNLILNPEGYSESNDIKGLIRYNELPYITDLCDMKILNSGKGDAKDISITLFVKRTDVFLTDRNYMWLGMSSMGDTDFSIINDNYIQKAHMPYMSKEGDSCSLPINSVLNGMIFSSIWNITHCLNFTDADFEKNLDAYYKKKNTNPMTVPEVYVSLEYSDLNDKRYRSNFRLSFGLEEHHVGYGVFIKPKIHYEKESNNSKYKKAIKEKKKKKNKINFRDKIKNNKLKIWRGYIYEMAMELNIDDDCAERISKDASFKRYLYNYLKSGYASYRELIICFVFCCIEHGIKISYGRKTFDIILNTRNKLLENKKIKLFNHEMIIELQKGEVQKLKKIASDYNILSKEYFDLYNVTGFNKEEVMVSNGNVHFKVNIGQDLKTECGFYRLGYSYRLVYNQKSIESVIQHKYDNVEIGFLDETGMFCEKENKWECIYIH